jgi:hypothetical protein
MQKKTEQDYHNLYILYSFEWIGKRLPKSAHHKTTWRCPEGHEWEAPYSRIASGSGCPHCSNRFPKTEQDYHDLAKSRGLQWIGKRLPKNNKHKTAWRCPKGHEWETMYTVISRGSGCPHCIGNIRHIEQDYHNLAKSRGLQWIGKRSPKSAHHKTTWRCPKGHEWEARYNNIRKGSGCPHCLEFKGPERIKEVLRAMSIIFEIEKRFETCRNKRPLPFDFFIPSAKLLIEYQGEGHFKSIWGPLSKQKRNDKIKADWASESPYELLTINYDQFDRIPQILADRLHDFIGQEYYKQGRLF